MLERFWASIACDEIVRHRLRVPSATQVPGTLFVWTTSNEIPAIERLWSWMLQQQSQARLECTSWGQKASDSAEATTRAARTQATALGAVWARTPGRRSRLALVESALRARSRGRTRGAPIQCMHSGRT